MKRVLRFANSGSNLGLAKYWGVRAFVIPGVAQRGRAPSRGAQCDRASARNLTQAITRPVVVARVARLQRARMYMIEINNATAWKLCVDLASPSAACDIARAIQHVELLGVLRSVQHVDLLGSWRGWWQLN